MAEMQVLDEADLQARYERLLNILMRQGHWLAGPQAKLLPEEEWDARFAHYQEQLDQLRLLGDALRPITLREYTPLDGDSVVREVRELFEENT